MSQNMKNPSKDNWHWGAWNDYPRIQYSRGDSNLNPVSINVSILMFAEPIQYKLNVQYKYRKMRKCVQIQKNTQIQIQIQIHILLSKMFPYWCLPPSLTPSAHIAAARGRSRYIRTDIPSNRAKHWKNIGKTLEKTLENIGKKHWKNIGKKHWKNIGKTLEKHWKGSKTFKDWKYVEEI